MRRSVEGPQAGLTGFFSFSLFVRALGQCPGVDCSCVPKLALAVKVATWDIASEVAKWAEDYKRYLASPKYSHFAALCASPWNKLNEDWH